MDFDETTQSTKVIITTIKMSAQYIVEWNGDDDREEFSNKDEAIKFALQIVEDGYEGYICIEACEDGDGADKNDWNIIWEQGDEECDGEFEEDEYGVLGFVSNKSGWLYAEPYCFNCGRKACADECICDEDEMDWREEEYKKDE